MKKIIVNKSWCKKCGICADFCSFDVLKFEPDSYPVAADMEKCTGCRLCELRCPDFAITVEEEEK